ncbi:MAG TPA: response regulator [bacterium]|jgi:two-component system KDP operon response regulator KdpE|nr:response regulator [bacterium]HXB97667.1 response regulator [bacterium]
MKAGKRVLVVDDEQAIRRLLKAGLEAAGYQVLEAADGEKGLSLAATEAPELVVLDLGLPGLGGAGVLKRLREWSQVPVLVLTVQDSEADKVALLDAGADDYLTKPFGVPELLARLRVLERHRLGHQADPMVRAGNLEIDLAAHLVRRDGQEVKLTSTEFEFLRVLAQHAGKVVVQRELLKQVWGPNAVEHSHYLRIYAANLRKKLEEDPADPKLIVTEPGVGYRLKA